MLPAITETAIRELVSAAKRAVRYLQHPDVQEIPFALPASNIVRNLNGTIRQVEAALAHVYRANPQIVVYGNPPELRVRRFGGGQVVGVISRDVHKLWYKHADTGEDHYHDFEPGDLLIALESQGQRDLLLTNQDGRPLWGEFD